MDEILPGVLHWTAYHGGIGSEVHSHLHVPSGALFDPLLPEDVSPGTLADAGVVPSVVLLSNRHHLRSGAAIADAFGIEIRCQEAGLWEFEDEDVEVRGFAYGEEVAPGVAALELGVLTPEDTVFRLDAGPGALLFADGLTRPGDELAFVPDGLMGDDPEAVRRGLTDRLEALAAREDFDALLFAHGAPLPEGGRAALRAFVDAR